MLRRIPTVPSLFASTSRTRAFSAPARPFPRLRTAKQPQSSLAAEETSSSHAEPSNAEPATHYRITLMRSALGLPSYARETLAALGLKKRMQHVFHPFSGTTAGQILRVKELVVVQNVPASAVRTKQEERLLRRPNRGFQVLGRQGRPWAVEDEFAGVTREQEQELTEEGNAANVDPAFPASTSARSFPVGVRAFHTSSVARTASLVAPVLPQPLTHESTPEAIKYLDSLSSDLIPRNSCVVEFSRSSGPGGQNVNKLNTKATLRMSLRPLPKWVPAWCEEGLRSSKEYAPSSHSIVIQSSATRSQGSNVEDCFRKLRDLVDHHARDVLVPVPDEAKQKRVEGLMKKDAQRRRAMKDKQHSTKASRRGGGGGDW